MGASNILIDHELLKTQRTKTRMNMKLMNQQSYFSLYSVQTLLPQFCLETMLMLFIR